MHYAFLYISLPSLHDYNVKMPNFTKAETQVQEMAQVREAVKLTNVMVTDCMANFLGRGDPGGDGKKKCEQNK